MSLSKGKILFLLILVGIPAAVIIMLNTLGENKFDLPEYFQDSIPAAYAHCEIAAPYRVDLVQAGISAGELGTVIAFPEPSKERNEIDRLTELLLAEDVISMNVLVTFDQGFGEQIQFSQNRIDSLLNCVFLVKTFEYQESHLPMFLVDGNGVIRGYYNATDVTEADRLLTEIAILKREDGK